MIVGCRVDLLVQGKAEAPRAALARLGVSVESVSVRPDAGESPRSLLLQCLQHVTAAGGSRSATSPVNVLLRTRVIAGLRDPRMAHRNRALFLVAVLAGDAAAAAALVHAGAVEALCEVMGASGASRPSVIERQWGLVALSHIAGTEFSHARHFIKANVPALLLAVITEASERMRADADPATSDACAAELGGAPVAAEAAQGNDAERGAAGGQGQPRSSLPPSPTLSYSSEPATESWPPVQGAASSTDQEDARAHLGLCYAASAVVANLSLHKDGARALVTSGLLPALAPLLAVGRGTVSLPCARWLCTHQRSAIHNASLGGGAARAVLNLGYTSHDNARALLGAGALPWLQSLTADPRASEKVREIAHRAAAYLSEIECLPEPAEKQMEAVQISAAASGGSARSTSSESGSAPADSADGADAGGGSEAGGASEAGERSDSPAPAAVDAPPAKEGRKRRKKQPTLSRRKRPGTPTEGKAADNAQVYIYICIYVCIYIHMYIHFPISYNGAGQSLHIYTHTYYMHLSLSL